MKRKMVVAEKHQDDGGVRVQAVLTIVNGSVTRCYNKTIWPVDANFLLAICMISSQGLMDYTSPTSWTYTW